MHATLPLRCNCAKGTNSKEMRVAYLRWHSCGQRSPRFMGPEPGSAVDVHMRSEPWNRQLCDSSLAPTWRDLFRCRSRSTASQCPDDVLVNSGAQTRRCSDVRLWQECGSGRLGSPRIESSRARRKLWLWEVIGPSAQPATRPGPGVRVSKTAFFRPRRTQRHAAGPAHWSTRSAETHWKRCEVAQARGYRAHWNEARVCTQQLQYRTLARGVSVFNGKEREYLEGRHSPQNDKRAEEV